MRRAASSRRYVLRKETGISQGFDFFDDEMPTELARAAGRPGQARRRRVGSRSPSTGSTAVGSSRAFLFLHLDEPHEPYAPPARFAEFAPYDAEIAYADEIVGRLVRLPEDAPALRPLDDRPAVRSRRGARRSRRAGARPVRLRRSDPRAAHHQAGRSNAGAGRRVSDLVQHRRPRADVLDLAKAPDPGQPPRPIAEAAARRDRPNPGPDASTPNRCSDGTISAGAS